jgi:hypothetical protein
MHTAACQPSVGFDAPSTTAKNWLTDHSLPIAYDTQLTIGSLDTQFEDYIFFTSYCLVVSNTGLPKPKPLLENDPISFDSHRSASYARDTVREKRGETLSFDETYITVTVEPSFPGTCSSSSPNTTKASPSSPRTFSEQLDRCLDGSNPSREHHSQLSTARSSASSSRWARKKHRPGRATDSSGRFVLAKSTELNTRSTKPRLDYYTLDNLIEVTNRVLHAPPRILRR